MAPGLLHRSPLQALVPPIWCVNPERLVTARSKWVHWDWESCHIKGLVKKILPISINYFLFVALLPHSCRLPAQRSQECLALYTLTAMGVCQWRSSAFGGSEDWSSSSVNGVRGELQQCFEVQREMHWPCWPPFLQAVLNLKLKMIMILQAALAEAADWKYSRLKIRCCQHSTKLFLLTLWWVSEEGLKRSWDAFQYKWLQLR